MERKTLSMSDVHLSKEEHKELLAVVADNEAQFAELTNQVAALTAQLAEIEATHAEEIDSVIEQKDDEIDDRQIAYNLELLVREGNQKKAVEKERENTVKEKTAHNATKVKLKAFDGVDVKKLKANLATQKTKNKSIEQTKVSLSKRNNELTQSNAQLKSWGEKACSALDLAANHGEEDKVLPSDDVTLARTIAEQFEALGGKK
jgi:hypothetical protein